MVRNAQGDMVNWARGIVTSSQEEAVRALEGAMQDGAETMVGIIATSGTAKSGKEGRIESRNMISSVKHRVDIMRRGRARGFFGWLDAWNNPDNRYFTFQDTGFKHTAAGWITGMYATRDAADFARQSFQRRVSAISGKIKAPRFNKRQKMM